MVSLRNKITTKCFATIILWIMVVVGRRTKAVMSEDKVVVVVGTVVINCHFKKR